MFKPTPDWIKNERKNAGDWYKNQRKHAKRYGYLQIDYKHVAKNQIDILAEKTKLIEKANIGITLALKSDEDFLAYYRTETARGLDKWILIDGPKYTDDDYEKPHVQELVFKDYLAKKAAKKAGTKVFYFHNKSIVLNAMSVLSDVCSAFGLTDYDKYVLEDNRLMEAMIEPSPKKIKAKSQLNEHDIVRKYFHAYVNNSFIPLKTKRPHDRPPVPANSLDKLVDFARIIFFAAKQDKKFFTFHSSSDKLLRFTDNGRIEIDVDFFSISEDEEDTKQLLRHLFKPYASKKAPSKIINVCKDMFVDIVAYQGDVFRLFDERKPHFYMKSAEPKKRERVEEEVVVEKEELDSLFEEELEKLEPISNNNGQNATKLKKLAKVASTRKTEDEDQCARLAPIAAQYKKNMENAKQELMNANARLSGKIVESDHVVLPGQMDFVTYYSLDPNVLCPPTENFDDSDYDAIVNQGMWYEKKSEAELFGEFRRQWCYSYALNYQSRIELRKVIIYNDDLLRDVKVPDDFKMYADLKEIIYNDSYFMSNVSQPDWVTLASTWCKEKNLGVIKRTSGDTELQKEVNTLSINPQSGNICIKIEFYVGVDTLVEFIDSTKTIEFDMSTIYKLYRGGFEDFKFQLDSDEYDYKRALSAIVQHVLGQTWFYEALYVRFKQQIDLFLNDTNAGNLNLIFPELDNTQKKYVRNGVANPHEVFCFK